MRPVDSTLALVVTVMALAACSTSTTSSDTPSDVVNCADTNLPQAEWVKYCAPALAPPPTTTTTTTTTTQPSVSTPLGFGEIYRSERGSITVSPPAPYKPSKYAAMGSDNKRAVITTITVTNTSAEVIRGFEWRLAITADGQSGNELYDIDVRGGPTKAPDILPGKSGSWRTAFGLPVAHPADVVLSVSWILGDPIYWTGTA